MKSEVINQATFLEDIAELETAEEFLDYFAIPYEPAVVQVNRLHILQRFHDYLRERQVAIPADNPDLRELYMDCLQRAYQDFVDSDALTEKVFKVFHRRSEPQSTFVPLTEVFK
jgi:nitrogenase-stabilizing/protective protein